MKLKNNNNKFSKSISFKVYISQSFSQPEPIFSVYYLEVFILEINYNADQSQEQGELNSVLINAFGNYMVNPVT